jgi:hypothetical protein
MDLSVIGIDQKPEATGLDKSGIRFTTYRDGLRLVCSE